MWVGEPEKWNVRRMVRVRKGEKSRWGSLINEFLAESCAAHAEGNTLQVYWRVAESATEILEV